MRDEFATSVKEVLAKRVGFRCSNPNCRLLTSGPNQDPAKVVNIGVAAHITAAATGGPRFKPELTAEDRKSLSNAIWLCQNHAKLIDSDDNKYTEALLRKWKELAEAAAALEVENGEVERSSPVAVISVAQSGGQTAHTIINQKPQRRTLGVSTSSFKSYLATVSPLSCTLHVLAGDPEAYALAQEIGKVLMSLRWTCEIVQGIGGTYPAGITLTRNQESDSSNVLLDALAKTGLRNVVGQAEFKGDTIAIYIGPNPDSYI